MYVQKIPLVLIRLAGPRILHGHERTRRTTNNLVPFRSFPSSLEGIKTRPNTSQETQRIPYKRWSGDGLSIRPGAMPCSVSSQGMASLY